MFDLENMFEYAEFVFRFRQENVTKQCSSALLVRMHPHYRLLPDGGGVRVSLSEIDNITYEECETNPF